MEENSTTLSESGGAVPVRRDRAPAPLARAAKAILDAEYATSLTIARVAEEVHASQALLSQTFKKAYGMPPVKYRHLLLRRLPQTGRPLVRRVASCVPAVAGTDTPKDRTVRNSSASARRHL